MTGPTIFGAQRFSDDDGSPDPRVRELLDAYSRGAAGERQVLGALVPSRLLVPVVAVAGEDGAAAPPGGRAALAGGDATSDIALPLMVGKDGRTGVPAFTCVESLQRWQEEARPVPVAAVDACVAAVDACVAAVDEGADALVVDVAGPVTYPVQGRFLTLLAERGAIPEPRDDPQVLARIYRVTHTEFGIERVRIHQSDRADIGIRLELERRDDEALRRVARRLNDELAPILPGGVDLSAVVRARRGE